MKLFSLFIDVVLLLIFTSPSLIVAASSSEHEKCHQVLLASSRTFLQSVNLYRESMTLRRSVLHEVIEGEVTPRLQEAYQLVSDEVAYGIGRYGLPSQLYFHSELDEESRRKLAEIVQESNEVMRQEEEELRRQEALRSAAANRDDQDKEVETVSSLKPIQETTTEHRKCHDKLLKLKKIIGITLAVEDEGGSIDDDEDDDGDAIENDEEEELLLEKKLFHDSNQNENGEINEEELIEKLTRIPHKTRISPVSHSKQEYGPSEPAGVNVVVAGEDDEDGESIYPTDDWIGTDDDVIEEALKFYHATV